MWTAKSAQILAARPDLVIASVPYQAEAVGDSAVVAEASALTVDSAPVPVRPNMTSSRCWSRADIAWPVFASNARSIVAASSAYFNLAFVNIGLMPDGGSTAFVPPAVGKARAFQMAFLGERIPAPQALEWGLVNWVYPDDRLMDEAQALVEGAARQKALALGVELPGAGAGQLEVGEADEVARLHEHLDQAHVALVGGRGARVAGAARSRSGCHPGPGPRRAHAGTGTTARPAPRCRWR